MQGMISHQPSHHGASDIQPARQLPEIPLTPPGPAHQFPEPEDCSGKARGRVTANTSRCVGPQVVVTMGSDISIQIRPLLTTSSSILTPYKGIG